MVGYYLNQNKLKASFTRSTVENNRDENEQRRDEETPLMEEVNAA